VTDAPAPRISPPDAKNLTHKLALGTAQFGLDYGISNAKGQVPLAEAGQIVARARQAGCDTLDTAIAYGNSESCLGQVGVGGWRVVSKLPAFPVDCGDLLDWCLQHVRASLQRLQIPRLDALLLHAPGQLAGSRGDGLFAALLEAKALGLVGRIGASIYSHSELEALIPRFPLELVQAPFNVLDQGLVASGWAQRLTDMGVEVHLRSAFLQGLLLMGESERPAKFAPWQTRWRLWHDWLDATGLTPVQACLGCALGQGMASRVVVGVASLTQLDEILGAAHADVPSPPTGLACPDAKLINPSLWSLR
jgi:aryl-alcohol dehydrogenase-like predicted oxidoreductase